MGAPTIQRQLEGRPCSMGRGWSIAKHVTGLAGAKEAHAGSGKSFPHLGQQAAASCAAHLESGIAQRGGQHAGAQQDFVALHHAATHCRRRWSQWGRGAEAASQLRSMAGLTIPSIICSKPASETPRIQARPALHKPSAVPAHLWQAPLLPGKRAPQRLRCRCPAQPPRARQ